MNELGPLIAALIYLAVMLVLVLLVVSAAIALIAPDSGLLDPVRELLAWIESLLEG